MNKITPHPPTHALIHNHRTGTRHWITLAGLPQTIRPGVIVTDRMGSLSVRTVR